MLLAAALALVEALVAALGAPPRASELGVAAAVGGIFISEISGGMSYGDDSSRNAAIKMRLRATVGLAGGKTSTPTPHRSCGTADSLHLGFL